MQIALVQDGNIIKIGNLYEIFPNVSFPSSGPDSEFFVSNSAMEVISWTPFNTSTEKQLQVEPYIQDNKVYTCITILKTEQELQEDALILQTAKEIEVRTQRNQLLKDSDWTQVSDAPVDKTAWATYRQALRDLTSQEGFPFNVVFPEPPLG